MKKWITGGYYVMKLDSWIGLVVFASRVILFDSDNSMTETLEEKLERIVACDTPSSCQDGRIEVISHSGNFHLGQIRVGLSTAKKLCQLSVQYRSNQA
jgi:hypothetical protein